MNPPNRIQVPMTLGQTLSPASSLPQKLSSSGSATGNPRNKCALKPGHSLMAWIRLGNSGVDLAGTGGRVTPVSSEELARHNIKDDAWLAIRGKVYNVTRYMDFHPGGVDELMRGVGRDATKLFDDVHAWVNYQQLLGKCYIGPLRGSSKAAAIPQDKIQSTNNSNDPGSAEIIPRFDWIQKRHEFTLYLYTRQFCNPGLLLKQCNDKELRLQVLIENTAHQFDFELLESVNWPPKSVRIGSETGKIEVVLVKTEATLWPNYGTHIATKLSLHTDETEWQYEYEIVTCNNFNHDSYQLRVESVQQVLVVTPVGHHVNIGLLLNGEVVPRSYTPIDVKYVQKYSGDRENDTTSTHLNFLIKCYSSGTLTSQLQKMKPSNMLLLSLPRGNLSLSLLARHRQIALLAAGSGLTPFLNLIDHLLKRNTNRIEYLRLFYFNKTEADIWCREELQKLETADERFSCAHVLSAPSDEWRGLSGRISTTLLTPLVDKNASEYASYVAVCGPSGFNQAAEQLLKDLKFNTQNLHIFQG